MPDNKSAYPSAPSAERTPTLRILVVVTATSPVAFERAPDRAYFGSNFKATPFMQ
jgi:hypothetical protein